jgi:transcriptional regulator with XRE-family HTH domain
VGGPEQCRFGPCHLRQSSLCFGEALIKARIMRNLSQKELAERLSLAEQQVQRYEATRYRGVAAERLQEVADALKLKVREVFTLEKARLRASYCCHVLHVHQSNSTVTALSYFLSPTILHPVLPLKTGYFTCELQLFSAASFASCADFIA